MGARPLVAVAVGGVLGSGLRLAIDYAVPHGDAEFPVSTLMINVVGAFALGFLVARVWPTAAPWLRAGLGAGLLGSFTTFSAFAVSLVALTAAHELWLAAVYLVATVALGLGAAWLGLRAGTRRASADRNEASG